MKNFNSLLSTTLALIILFCNPAMAQLDGTNELLLELQKDWAVANYQLKDKAQDQAFETLSDKADSTLSQHPGDVNLQIWAGIIKSTYAGIKGGLGALGLAKAAKKHLEAAMEIDKNALSGSALTSLGTLYNKVPGWPVGFGSSKKAEALLMQALEVDSDGIDSNYFYADFLIEEKQYSLAKQHLEKALLAEPRAGREVADEGRRKDILLALAKVQKRTGS